MTFPNFFPYRYRPGQEDIVRLVRDAVHDGHNLVIESGTGTGKTSVALSAALEAVQGTRRKVIFLTRTKSQQRQIALEARAIGHKTEVLCASMQGRGPATCPLMDNNPELISGTSEELSKLCATLKKGNSDAGRCMFYDNLSDDKIEALVSFMRSSHPDPEEFREFCSASGICPYEASKRVLQYADVISAPYAFFFVPEIRAHFLEWAGICEREAVLIIDEAHNVPSYLREIQSYHTSERSMALSLKEADDNGDPELLDGITVRDVVQMMQEILIDVQAEYLRRDNDLIPPGYLQEEMMSRLGMTTFEIRNLLINMYGVGEAIADAKKHSRKLPRSHILALSRFLLSWLSCEDSSHVFLVAGGGNPSLEAYCLDPRDVAEEFNYCHSTVHMSGTLAPLESYCLELGLYEPWTECFPSPFNLDNLKVGFVRGVSTKYTELNGDDTTYERLKEYVVTLVNCVHKNTAVFFPSYSLMERFIEDDIPHILNRDIYYERSDMPQSELMDQMTEFKCNDGAVLFAVTGGRISEGLDFPGRELELAIIIGIPYGRPSAKQDALIGYSQSRFGKGWDMAVKVPAIRKIRQAIGRLIRSENDRGVAVILDYRVASMSELHAVPFDDPIAEVKRFFGQQ